MPRIWVTAASPNSYGSRVARDRDRQGGANPAAVPARADLDYACKCESTPHDIGAGSPRCVDELVDYAARGSREGTACRGNSWCRRPSEHERHWKNSFGRRRGSHRRSRSGNAFALMDVAMNTSVPRALAREAGRGERTVAPCPRPAGDESLTPPTIAGAHGGQLIGGG